MLSLPIGRRETKKILFYAESPVKYAMFRPIQQRMARDGRVDFYFAGQLRGADTSKRMAAKLGVEDARSIRRGMAGMVEFDLFLTADYDLWTPFFKGRLPIVSTRKVQLFHGASVRNGAIQPKMRRYHRLFVIGPYMYRAFLSSGIVEEGDPSLAKIGMPKVDRLVDGSLDGLEIRGQLGFDNDQPIVMLAPTWLRDSPMSRYGEELLKGLAAGPWNLVVKLHDKFFDPRFNTINWRRRLKEYVGRDNCKVLIDDYDAVPYLFVTDLLISDVSSIANEFALLDRPLVYLQVGDPEKLSEQYPFLDLETWGQHPGEMADGPDECVRAVERGLSDPSARSDIRRELTRDIFYEPGKATEKAVGELERLLELGDD